MERKKALEEQPITEDDMKLHLSCPDEVTKKLDEYVDGIQFRNRTQLIRWILFMKG